MKALIIEDELMAQKNLTRILNKHYPEIEIVGYLDSVKSSIEWFKSGKMVDIVFMDVELSDDVCFEIYRQVEIKANIIMTTAYDNYALKAFEAGSIDYILKPIDIEALKRAVNRCKTKKQNLNIENMLKAIGIQKEKYRERYIVKLNDRIIPVKTSEIAYFYSEEKTNYIVTKGGGKYIIDLTLDEIVEDLDPKKFFKISRSCITSMDAITSIIRQSGGRLKITPQPESTFEMTVSRSRVDDFFEWLN